MLNKLFKILHKNNLKEYIQKYLPRYRKQVFFVCLGVGALFGKAIITRLWQGSELRLPSSYIQVLPLKPVKVKPLIHLSGTTYTRETVLKSPLFGTVIEVMHNKKGVFLPEKTLVMRIVDHSSFEHIQAAQAELAYWEAEYRAAQQLKAKQFQTHNVVLEVKSKLELARARLKKLQLTADKTTIALPFTGIIQRYFVENGDTVVAGQKLVNISMCQNVQVGSSVSPQKIKDIKRGQAVEVVIPSYSKNVLHGTISYIASTADEKTMMFPFEVTLNSGDSIVPVGIPCSISILCDEISVYKVPYSALVLNDHGEMGVFESSCSKAETALYAFQKISPYHYAEENLWVYAEPGAKEWSVVGKGASFVPIR